MPGRGSKMKKSQFLFIIFCAFLCRHFLRKVFGRIGGWMRGLLPRVLLPPVGSDLRQPALSPRVVLSSRISIWTSDRYTSPPQASGRVKSTQLTVEGVTDPLWKGLCSAVARKQGCAVGSSYHCTAAAFKAIFFLCFYFENRISSSQLLVNCSFLLKYINTQDRRLCFLLVT